MKSSASMESMLQRLMALPSPSLPHTGNPAGANAHDETSHSMDSHYKSEWKPSNSTWGPLAEVWNANVTVPSSTNTVDPNTSASMQTESQNCESQPDFKSLNQFPARVLNQGDQQDEPVKTTNSLSSNPSVQLNYSRVWHWFLIVAGLCLWGLAFLIVLNALDF